MQAARSVGMGCALLCVVFSTDAVTVRGPAKGRPQDSSRATIMMQVSSMGVAKVKGASSLGMRLHYVNEPIPVSSQDMENVNRTGMTQRSIVNKTFYTYADTEDAFVSASIHGGTYWDADRTNAFCNKFSMLGGRADFLDVGANIGTWSVPIASCLETLGHAGSVISVEPMPDIVDHLKASLAANHIKNVRLYNYAVGDQNAPDELTMQLDTYNKGMSHVIGNHNGNEANSVTVQATTLDAILQDVYSNASVFKVFAMKMDVEGFENIALSGASALLTDQNRPCVMQVELKEGVKSAVTQLLQSKGYTVSQVAPKLQQGYHAQFVQNEDYLFMLSDFDACAARFAS